MISNGRHKEAAKIYGVYRNGLISISLDTCDGEINNSTDSRKTRAGVH